MSKKQVTQQCLMATDEVIKYLESLVESFKAGKIVVQQGDEFVSMTPPENVNVEVEAKQKQNKEKFSLELSWRFAEQAQQEEEKIKISAEEPEVNTEEDLKESEQLTEQTEEKEPSGSISF